MIWYGYLDQRCSCLVFLQSFSIVHSEGWLYSARKWLYSARISHKQSVVEVTNWGLFCKIRFNILFEVQSFIWEFWDTKLDQLRVWTSVVKILSVRSPATLILIQRNRVSCVTCFETHKGRSQNAKNLWKSRLFINLSLSCSVKIVSDRLWGRKNRQGFDLVTQVNLRAE